MKQYLPYTLIGIIAIAAVFLVVTASNYHEKTLDERISFRKKDKIPYGTYVAYEGLKHLFPGASISANNQEPGYWDSLSNYDGGQALIIVSPVFYADEFEMKKLIRFAENGNDVFISTAIVSDEAKKIMNCSISYLNMFDFFDSGVEEEDTLRVSLTNPPFRRSYSYVYPGKRLGCHFYKIDSSTTTVLGRGDNGAVNFIHLKAGQGNLYLHLAPMAFSNYFLLSDRNIGYYEDILSIIPQHTKTVVWDEYYLQKKSSSRGRGRDNSKGWLSALFKYDSLKWGLLTAIFALLVYVLLEMRRKQRYIPLITRPRNDSLDFVKTIGRLYYDKGDHKNLCRKMAAYFLEHVRTRYKLSTTVLNEDLIKNLQFKTGADETEIRNIVFFIRDMEGAPVINDHQLIYFHKRLESFYNKI
ncbi:MAG: hypothetical protein Q8941_11285 [Bacteroidota bacterium]|nr:hypothetical protein [Bacteroidota bacterium]